MSIGRWLQMEAIRNLIRVPGVKNNKKKQKKQRLAGLWTDAANLLRLLNHIESLLNNNLHNIVLYNIV